MYSTSHFGKIMDKIILGVVGKHLEKKKLPLVIAKIGLQRECPV